MLIGALIILGVIILDQVTKILAVAFISPIGHDVTIIPHLLVFGYHENGGASFNIFEGNQILFLVVTLVALGIFGYLFKDSDFKNKKVYSISVALFIGGTLGNAIDRLFRGIVVDFINFPFFDVLHYIGLSNFYNNIADIVLTAAIILFAVDVFFLESKRNKLKKAEVHDQNT